jgi:hypothetical protein
LNFVYSAKAVEHAEKIVAREQNIDRATTERRGADRDRTEGNSAP